ncbi:hypothetical protein IC582_001830 [Cucumis melo]|uniref:DUF1677 domain-containing protein n=3 Tax=Cucumis melo TaxID=3656 RepID=A0A5D3D0Q9_CUCMM|nr:hypothetical protein E6C27_scaffold333G00170 [Cucumis melo var. makuwa]TYK17783.1 hypothetical protein E5676_scaffold306G00250 [Cucumis melo var. makuwa]
MDEIEIVKCECCGLKEECTKDYISEVKANFDAKWLCGLCSQAVGDEILFKSKNNHHSPPPSSAGGIQDAVNAHMLFCRKFKSNPAVRVADGMKQILRRRSSDLSSQSSSSSNSTSSSHAANMSSFSSLR